MTEKPHREKDTPVTAPMVPAAQIAYSLEMAKAAVKLMQAAHMIEMAMRADGLQGPVSFPPYPVLQGAQPHARVDHQIMVAPPHMPDVAAQQAGHAGFLDQRDAVRNPGGGEGHGLTAFGLLGTIGHGSGPLGSRLSLRPG